MDLKIVLIDNIDRYCRKEIKFEDKYEKGSSKCIWVCGDRGYSFCSTLDL
jgi:hypothetical protein